MKKLSSSQLDLILQKLKAGHSHRQISLSTGASLGTISNIRSAHCSDLPKSPGGHSSILSPANIQYATNLLSRGKANTAVAVAKALSDVTNQPIHPQTVRRSLREAGLKAKKKKKKPFLSKRHRKERLDFAIKHQHYTVEDWKHHIFSDETKINRFGSDGMS
jgi:transposase